MKYLIRFFIITIISVPLLASAQLPSFNAKLPSLIVCDPVPTQGGQAVPCDFSALIGLANTVIRFLIILGTSVFSFMFMYAGYLYLTALGNTGKISKAHGIFWDAIIGFCIMLAAWLFVDFIFTSLVPSDKQGAYRLLSK